MSGATDAHDVGEHAHANGEQVTPGRETWQVMAGGDRRDADQALVAALAAGATKQEAARLAGVGERTIYRRLEDPDFRRRVDQARGELVGRVVGRLADASTAA